MVSFRSWEIRTGKKNIIDEENNIPHIPFRHIEKNMLYLTKHVVQGLVLVTVKYWFILVLKTKKMISEKWPKIHESINKRFSKNNEKKKMTFAKRAVLESKIKIKKMKQRIKEELD